MKSRVRISAAAWRSIGDIVTYLTLHASPKTALKFHKAFKKSCATLLRIPQIGAVWESANPGLNDLRFWPLGKPFHQYLVFYRIKADRILIMHVIHGSRDADSILSEDA